MRLVSFIFSRPTLEAKDLVLENQHKHLGITAAILFRWILLYPGS